jgi:hypothetical protein
MKRTVAVLFAVSLLATAALAQKAGSVKGFLKVDGKTVQLKHAVAVIGPDSFDETEGKTYIFLTEKPIAAKDIQKAETVGDIRALAATGIRLEVSADSPSAHVVLTHPALGKNNIQTGAGFGYKPTASGPERYTGTLQSWGADRNEDEEMFDHKLRYDLTYDVPVSRSFPLQPKLVLAANAKKVGPGGGEPGKAYMANCAKASNLPKTAKELEKQLEKEGELPTDADLEQMSKEMGKKVTRQDAVEFLFELMKLGGELAPKNCKVLGGGYDDKLAILQVEADVMGGRSRADAFMEKVDGKWTLSKHGTWTSK